MSTTGHPYSLDGHPLDAPASSERPRVIVAEGDADSRMEILRLLGDRFDVSAFPDGAEAFEAARAEHPDLVLCGVEMSGLDGPGLLHALRAERRTSAIPIIFLTPSPGEESHDGVRADDYLARPFSGHELLTRVSIWVELARLRRERESLRREREEETLQSEQEFNDFFDNAPIGLHLVGPDGTILRANQVELNMLGYSHDEYIGHSIIEFHVDRDVITDILRRLASGETIRDYKARLRARDGSIRHVMISSNVRWGDGRFLHTRCFTRDITELMWAEDRLEAVLSSIDDHLVCYDSRWRYTFVNDKAARVLGRTKEELLGTCIWEIFPDAVGNQYYQELHRAVEEQCVIRSEHYYPPFDLWFENHIYPSRDGVTVFSSDITRRKRAEQALRESDERFTRFTQHLPGLAWIKDCEGRYVYVNDVAARAFGLSAAEIYGKNDEEIFPPETAAQFRENDRQVQADGALQAVEVLDHPDGSRHYSLVSKFTIPDAQDRPSLIGGIAIDITERMHAEEALRQADRQKDQFLATLAHELRNPLAPIRNSLAILRHSDRSAEETRSIHEMLDQQVSHMVRLVDDLLEVSRITRGKIDLRRERIELATIIRGAIETSRPLIETAHHHLEVALPREPLILDADPVRMTQVISNILNNAAKYTDDGGEIRITAWREEGEAIIAIRDNGVGIPSEMLPHVFDMFAQVDRSLKRAQGGLGIGLALARNLVELHGGRIDARSDGPGGGSEFIVRLPLIVADGSVADDSVIPSPTLASHPSSLPYESGTASTSRILVVDDHRDAADSLVMLVKLFGGEARAAYDGTSALEVMREFRPTVILLDIGMPGMDGYEVAGRVRAIPELQNVILIALTGWGQEEDRRRTSEAGFDRHWVKPIDAASLKSLLHPNPPAEQ